ncbi:malto-oligosyltrehalose synthase [Amorphus orientalis]|uniref:(1->4)-alpha-D-glucan 1-alpha-D-glucosylmutase n=1 Tax=Amorphus orientalis TaxID=649198 RepID=A0AAE3VQU0_9HYPH|nr:malto-oligosyltrehalose synthase [Amorphus orientalis]MDQ0316486.1 (1->4)-alpha-D-glucan 1-alpha-D-glucosylmutase [Amorphus orientalis]
MTAVTATYRLQFRNGMTFDTAIGVVPTLKRLGISHLYASPIFTAVTGSTHGYDVTDFNEIDPALGGREGLDRLVAALKDAGLGLILDIVPNHMAASLENGWWHSVIEWGPASPYAGHFDVNWRERLTLPFLGGTFDDVLAAGDLKVVFNEAHGCLTLAYFDTFYPLTPSSYEIVTAAADEPLLTEVAAIAARATPDDADRMHGEIRRLLAEPEARRSVQAALDRVSANRDLLSTLHDAQPWRLMFWQEASRHLSYRRFFEITGLVGVRVDDAHVFEDAHRLILDLVRSGTVDGLRIDHVDGLADPTGYLARLRERVGPDTWLVVEKILEGDEALPAEWPIAGTTGYEFITSLAETLTDADGAQGLDRAYRDALGTPVSLDDERRAAKTLMATRNFAGEVTRLTDLLFEVAETERPDDMPAETTLQAAIVALVTAFPVYRTYGNAAGMADADRTLLETVATAARGQDPAPDGAALDLAVAALLGDLGEEARETAVRFRTLFQQLTGPVMAKAIEDTLFYRFNRLIAVNEVGGDPDDAFAPASAFHGRMAERVAAQPRGLLGTATHDTKRGEDARARLYALSEAPETWRDAVARWRRHNSNHVVELADGPAPDPNTEWLIYQALAGAFPEDLPTDPAALTALADRFAGYLEKAMREAKARTSWTEVDGAYEQAVQAYAARLLSPDNTGFLSDFTETLKPFVAAGRINSLAQTLIKMTAPGIPDIYQGTERGDFSLVDPDNRRPVDFARLDETLDASLPAWPAEGCPPLGAIKPHLIRTGLSHRHARPDLFTTGAYSPLAVDGARRDHLIAFARTDGRDTAVTLVPRLPLALLRERPDLRDPALWTDTSVRLPDAGRLTDAFSDARASGGSAVSVATLFARYPFAMLTSYAADG